MKPQIGPIAEVRFADLFLHLISFLKVFVVVDEVVTAFADRARVQACIFTGLGWEREADGPGEGERCLVFIVVLFVAGAETWFVGLAGDGRCGVRRFWRWRLGLWKFCVGSFRYAPAEGCGGGGWEGDAVECAEAEE